MGSPVPNPPSSTPAASAVQVCAVMAGQEWTDPNGGVHLAADDVVLIQLMDRETGQPAASLTQSPDSAIALAHLINNTAVRAINAQITDDGRKMPLSQRLNRISQAGK